MPGPGGGPHGGGGHGGGSHGGPHGGGMHHGGPHGGFRGEPFGGGMHHGPRPPRMYHRGWFRPRPPYYGGGCLGCLCVFAFPIILLVAVAIIF